MRSAAGRIATGKIGHVSITPCPTKGNAIGRRSAPPAQVEGAWNHAFVEELCAFPNGAHDDQVDAVSAAFRAVIRRRTVSAVGV